MSYSDRQPGTRGVLDRVIEHAAAGHAKEYVEWVCRLTDALRLIAMRDPKALMKWADENVREEHIREQLRRGYQTNYKGGYEYRGALVFVQREIARRVLDELPTP